MQSNCDRRRNQHCHSKREEGAGERGGLHRLKMCELRFTPEEEPEEGSCAGGETRRSASFSGGASGGPPAVH